MEEKKIPIFFKLRLKFLLRMHEIMGCYKLDGEL